MTFDDEPSQWSSQGLHRPDTECRARCINRRLTTRFTEGRYPHTNRSRSAFFKDEFTSILENEISALSFIQRHMYKFAARMKCTYTQGDQDGLWASQGFSSMNSWEASTFSRISTHPSVLVDCCLSATIVRSSSGSPTSAFPLLGPNHGYGRTIPSDSFGDDRSFPSDSLGTDDRSLGCVGSVRSSGASLSPFRVTGISLSARDHTPKPAPS